MKFISRIRQIACREISTLAWDGDNLIDATSNLRIHLDGTRTNRLFNIGYPFDRGQALRTPETLWTIAYENRGTKAALLKNGRIHRELNRSFNCAKAFDYPLAIAEASPGRAVIIHCPHSYDTVEFEDAETGEMLASRKSDGMEFHSRLAVSPDARNLISAGWFWHPICGLWLCTIRDSQRDEIDPSHDFAFSFGAEIDSAAFLGNDRIVVSTNAEVVNEEVPANGLGPLHLGVWSIANRRWESTVPINEPTGLMMPWREWVVSFHDHPKAIELATGSVVQTWDLLYSGRQVGAIELGDPAPPPMALDALNGRFAIADLEGVTVISMEAGD